MTLTDPVTKFPLDVADILNVRDNVGREIRVAARN
jgi:hypothetical protein